jgi:hypothetical protein
MPDLMTGQAKKVELEVKDKEVINEVSCFVVTVSNAANANDKTTLWVNEDTRLTEKMEQIAPAMGNAVITTTKM